MTITIGENIRKMRTEQNITQEQLAEALEVSPQAVSRWENEATYPDITLLPVIAGYFDVTVDELLGVDIERKEEEINKILDEVQKLEHVGKSYEASCLLREKIKEYPNSAELLDSLAGAVYCYYFQSGVRLDEKEFKEYAREVVELCKKAMKYTSKPVIIHNCNQLLVYNYFNLEEYDKAKEIAEKLPTVWISQEMILPRAIKDTKERVPLYQQNILDFVDILDLTIDMLDGCADYDVQQKLELKQMLEKLILTALGENPRFYNERLFHNGIGIAWEFAKLKRFDEAVDTLEKAWQYAVNFEERPAEGKYSVFWLSEVTDQRESTLAHNEKTLYDFMAEHLTNFCYHDKFFENNERVKALKEKAAAKTAAK